MNSPLRWFEKIWIINLPAREDRRQEMSRQLERVGLSFRSPGVALFPALRPTEAGGFPTVGARGCFLSHLGVLTESVAQRHESILILEDDVNFARDIGLRIDATMKAAAEHSWSVFYGGYELEEALELERGDCVPIGAAEAVRTAHFVGFRGAAIAAAASHLGAMVGRPPGDPLGGPMHVDGAYSWFRRVNPQFATVVAVPPLGYQRASRTDIHELRWYDRWVGARDVVARIRRWRNG